MLLVIIAMATWSGKRVDVDWTKQVLHFSLGWLMMAVGIEAYFHEKRMSDEGRGVEAYHQEMRKLHSFCCGWWGLNEANFCFGIRMSEDVVGVEAHFLQEMTTHYYFVVRGSWVWWESSAWLHRIYSVATIHWHQPLEFIDKVSIRLQGCITVVVWWTLEAGLTHVGQKLLIKWETECLEIYVA